MTHCIFSKSKKNVLSLFPQSLCLTCIEIVVDDFGHVRICLLELSHISISNDQNHSSAQFPQGRVDRSGLYTEGASTPFRRASYFDAKRYPRYYELVLKLHLYVQKK